MADALPIAEAARRLGVSPDTVRRRLKSGELVGRKQATRQGFVWLVEVPEQEAAARPTTDVDRAEPGELERLRAELATLHTRISDQQRLELALREQLEAYHDRVAAQETELDARRREVGELHVVLREQTQRMLPPPVTGELVNGETSAPRRRSWWRWWGQ